MISKIARTFGGLLLILVISGCSNQDSSQSQNNSRSGTTTEVHHDHDHGHIDQFTFREIAEKLIDMDGQIRNGLASDDEHAAHEPLHEVGHVLENLSNLARNEGLSKDVVEAVEQAKEDLFTAFGNIDKTFHGEEGSTYDEESSVIQSALSVVKDAAGIK